MVNLIFMMIGGVVGFFTAALLIASGDDIDN